MNYCKVCGEKLEPSAKFCQECGAKQEADELIQPLNSEMDHDTAKKKRVMKAITVFIGCLLLIAAGAYLNNYLQHNVFNQPAIADSEREEDSRSEEDGSGLETGPGTQEEQDIKENEEEKNSDEPVVLLKDLNVYSLQSLRADGSKNDVRIKTAPELAADGMLYQDSITFYTGDEGYVQSCKMDFLINDRDYSWFKTEFLLTNEKKSFPGNFIIKILGDDTEVLYKSDVLTGGFIPQKVDVSVKGISKLSIVVESTKNDNNIYKLGLVFKDAGLYL